MDTIESHASGSIELLYTLKCLAITQKKLIYRPRTAGFATQKTNRSIWIVCIIHLPYSKEFKQTLTHAFECTDTSCRVISVLRNPTKRNIGTQSFVQNSFPHCYDAIQRFVGTKSGSS